MSNNKKSPAQALPTAGEVIGSATHHEPDNLGQWGDFGGRYIPEALMAVIDEITDAWGKAKTDPEYLDTLDDLHRNYSGRPSPLYYAERFSKHVGAQVWLKREDLNHTGSTRLTTCSARLCWPSAWVRPA